MVALVVVFRVVVNVGVLVLVDLMIGDDGVDGVFVDFDVPDVVDYGVNVVVEDGVVGVAIVVAMVLVVTVVIVMMFFCCFCWC